MNKTWISQPKNIVVLVLTGLLTIAAVFGVIWGVTHQTEIRPLNVVWVENQARYLDWPTEESTELAFPHDQIPITTVVEDENGDLYHKGSFQWGEVAGTVFDFNTQVGFELFRMKEELPASAEVIWAAAIVPGPDRIAGSARHTILPNGDLHGLIKLYDTTSISSTRRNGLHELGHLASLPHNDSRGSVMYPLSREDQMGTSTSSMRLMDGEIRLLQKLYRD